MDQNCSGEDECAVLPSPPIGITSSCGKLLYINDLGARFLGRTTDALLLTNYQTYTDEGDWSVVKDSIYRALNTKEPVISERRYRRPDGSVSIGVVQTNALNVTGSEPFILNTVFVTSGPADIIVPGEGLTRARLDLAEYVELMSAELASMARQHGEIFLSYLLKMAELEARRQQGVSRFLDQADEAVRRARLN